MANSAINISANAQEVINLRKRIDELKAALSSMRRSTDPQAYDKLNRELQTSSIRYNRLVGDLQRYVVAQQQAERATRGTESSMSNMQKMLLQIGGTTALIALGKQVIDVRAEMQMLEQSFDVLLGGKDVSKFMSELKQFAVDSPLSLTGVANAAQTLLGFNVEADKTIPIIKQIGDISMGNEERFKSLTLAFAQMSATGKLMGQDLLQMINAGFNPLQEISSKTGKSIADLKKEMENGAISSQMVADAFASATAQGGRFYGMTEKQAQGVKGLQAQLDGGLQDAFNEIGQSQEGIIAGGYKMSISLVENYDKVGKALITIVSAYGAYKAALITAIALERVKTTVAVYDIATKQIQLGITLKNIAAQSLLNKVMMANPYALAAVLVVSLVGSLWALSDSLSAAERAQSALNRETEKQTKSNEEERSSIESLISAIKDDTKTRNEKQKALDTLQAKYPAIFLSLDIEKIKNLELANAIRLVNEELEKRNGMQSKSNIDRAKEILKGVSNFDGVTFKTATDQKDAKDILGLEGAWDRNIITNAKLKKGLEEYIKKAERKIQDDAVIASQAEFNSLPKSNRVNILKNDVDKLQVQYDRLKALAKEEKNNPFSSGLSSYTSQMDILESQINTKNSQIKALQEDSSKTSTRDKAYWEKQKKDAESRLAVLSDVAAQGKEGDALRKEILGYDKKLKSYDAKDTSKSAETAAEKARKTAQKTLDDQLKLDNDKAKASLDARNQELENQQALLNLQEDGFKKEQKQAEINHQKELLSIDKRAQELIEAKQKAERDAWDIKNPNPKTTYVNKTVSSSDLLLGQQSELNNSRDIANRTQIKANADLLKNLLEKYQDFNTKKIAVDKQYNKDVQALESQRTNDNSESINRSISQLKKQYKESISAINIEELRESIDWQTVFGDIDRVSSQSIENLRSKLKEYASEAGKNLAPTDMKILTDAIDQLDKKYAELKPNKAFTDSFNDYKAATDNVKRLRQELEVIKSGGNITIGAEYDKESGKMTTVVKTQTQAEKDLTDAQDKRRQSLISLGTALQGYVSKSQQYLDLANETVSTLEAFGVKVPEGVSKTLEGLGQISSGMDDVSKGLTSMNPVLIAQGGIKALGGLANAVQGIFGKRNKAAEDTKRLQDVTEKVSVANDAINSLLEKRIELIKESTAAERQHLSVLTNESLDAYQDYYDEQFNRLLGNDLYGKKGKNNNLSVEDVMKMYGLSSPEDFAKWWQSGGYGALTLQGYDLRDKDKYDSWASAYMDMIDKRKELAQTMDEEATQVSFDSFRDSFLDTLSDMDSSSKDFAENFEGYLQKAMLNSLLTEKYQERIKNLYSMFSDYNADGNIDESEYKKLQDYEKQLTDDMIADRDRLKKSFGWDSSTSQSASSGYSTSMSQDTGEAIEGRMTAMQMNLISIDGNVARIAEWSQPFDLKYNVDVLTAPLSALNESCQRIELMLEQNRNIAIQSYYELKDINKQTKELYPIRTGIDTMNKTLSNL